MKDNHSKSNYRSINGSEPGATTTPTGTVSIPSWNYYDGTGVFSINKAYKFSDISDGTSSTLAITECLLNPDTPGTKNAAIWLGIHSTNPSFTISDVTWFVNGGDFFINALAFQSPSSRHPGGAHFAICDGSTRFLNEKMSTQIFEAMGTRRGREPVGEF